MSNDQGTSATETIVEIPLQSGQFNTADALLKPNEAELTTRVAGAQEGDAAETTEPKPEEPKKPDAAEEAKKVEEAKFAAKFAALSRKEKQLRERERAVEARMKAIEEQLKTKETELTGKYIDPARFKKEPLKVMEETGLTFQQLAEMVLNDGKQTPEMLISEREKAIQAKIDALEAKLADKDAKEQENKLAQQIQSFKGEIQTFIKNNTADYELIGANNAFDLVYEVIEAHHARTAEESDDGQGEILDTKTAADAVESHLLEEAKKVLGLSKIKGMLQPEASKQPDAKASTAGATTPTAKTVAKTLSNANSVTAPATKRKLSNEESMVEAAKLIRWND